MCTLKRSKEVGWRRGAGVSLCGMETNIKFARSNFTKAKWLVTIISPIFKVGAIFQLFFSGKIEEFLANCELVVNFLLTEAKVHNIEEAFKPLDAGTLHLAHKNIPIS